MSREYFEEIEAHRYRSHPWILTDIDSFDIAGRDVLEIGFGMGTDHLALARTGARMHGIDLTPRNIEVTKRRLEVYGATSELTLGDAESLPFPDESFDFVYSFGVVHHSPDTPRIIEEVRRVLRPGGKCHLTVYHRDSVFFWWSVFGVNYVLRGGWLKRSLRQQISLVEYPNTTEDMVIRLYRRKEFLNLFGSFSESSARVQHLVPADIELLGWLMGPPDRPRSVLNALGRRFGWYVVVDATK